MVSQSTTSFGDGRPRVLIVGGPDVDARIDLMQALGAGFCMAAAGSSSGIRARFAEAGLDYHRYFLDRGKNPFFDLRTLVSLVRLFWRVQPHIVHTFDTKPCVWGPLAASAAPVPAVVATLTGVGGALYMSESLTIRAVRTLYLSLQRLACKATDATVFQNREDAELFVSGQLVSADETHIIPGSGVATSRFAQTAVSESARRQLRCELGIQANERVVTMVSRVIRSKGVLEFAAAAQEVRARFPQVRFLLVGAEDSESIDRLTADEMTCVRRMVTATGPRQDIAVVLALSDVFVLPSTYREGVPRVLLEAASMGLPLVTTDSPGCNAVVADGVNGFLVPPRDPVVLSRTILALVENFDLRRRFGRASRQRAIEHFDLSLIASQTESVYREVLDRAAARTGRPHLLPLRDAPQ
jgi:glycosyltransferase involved in cell wall biosynthesis